jgi:8-oxo-dGTP pyrophosphatase MutT (NUDIX family)
MKDLKRIEEKFGRAKEMTLSFELEEKEFTNLLDSMQDGRNSDVTLFIFKDEKVITIAKPWYKEGLFRAPSGGLKLNEDLEECAKREAYEETGAIIDLKKYILRIKVTFLFQDSKVDWTSHIFTVKYLSGELKPIDKRKIKEVKLLSLEELEKLKPLLENSISGGLKYRAALTEKSIKEIKKLR